MYEAEVNSGTEPIESLPSDIRAKFCELRGQITDRTTLPWGEHCTECVWPTCYSNCELYSPRTDGACRQFVGGVVRVDNQEGANPYLVRIQFKQWAKIWSVGSLQLKPVAVAERHESLNILAGALGRNTPLPAVMKRPVLQKISYVRRILTEKARRYDVLPDCFLLECHNPNQFVVNLTFTTRLRFRRECPPYQKFIQLLPGYNRISISLSEITARVPITEEDFEIEIIPNQADDTVLYFGLLDFVKERAVSAPTAGSHQQLRKFKCIVWDLDNTLWDGVLIEDGPDKVRIRPEVVEVIRSLDQRGILHSIASKNNTEDALRVLRQNGLDEYFLYPQIHWSPKSQSLASIAQLLNIDTNTIAFVDDQEFERQEVQTVLPHVTTIDAVEAAMLPDRLECQVPVTKESKARRSMYREQQQREHALSSFGGDYLAFLRSCQIEVEIRRLEEKNLKRVYELAQRTNQLNYSGNRYEELQLREMMNSPHLETYVIECGDRFGKYGIVGFSVVDTREPRMLDLMFSCRVQGKRVEHGFLSFLLKRYTSSACANFFANYRRTTKNAPAGAVFEQMGFEQVGEKEGVLSLVFRNGVTIQDDELVNFVNHLDASGAEATS